MNPLSTLFGLGVRVRNALYDGGFARAQRLNGPVMSIGNLSVGGSGKTPFVLLLGDLLKARGLTFDILSRGYGRKTRGVALVDPAGSARDFGDEPLLMARRLNVPVIVGESRHAAGVFAEQKFGPQLHLLDDGFQHRRLARDLNIVLVDATEPLGIPGLLPRGTWREPPHNLKRANMIMLTRCEQVSPELADLASGLLTQWVSPRAIYQQRTAVVGLYDAEGNAVPLIAGGEAGGGRRVAAFAGIGNPQGFLHTVQSLGMNVVTGCWFDDHHRYESARDFARLAQVSGERGLDAWVTTMKDWVKLRGKPMPAGAPPVWHVRIEARLTPHEHELLRSNLGTLGG